MSRALAPLLVSLLVLAGCATSRAPVTTGPGQKESAPAALARAVGLVEAATVASLTEASGLLATGPGGASGDAGSAPGAPALLAVAGRIFTRLYPELPSPFPDAPLPSDSSSVSAFLGKVMPALDRLGPVSASAAESAAFIDETRAAALQMDLAAADAMNGASVLPHWLQALLEKTRGSARAVVRPLLEEALRRDPGFYPAARELAALIVAGGAAAAELPLLERLAAIMPTPALRFETLARAELAAGQPQKAADAAAQGLLAAPEDTGFVLLRAETLAALGDWYQSLRVLDAALKFQPDLLPALLMKARLLHQEEKNDPEALLVIDDAESRYPDEASVPELRGSILIDMGRSDDGVAALKRAFAIDPQRAVTLSLLLRQAAAARQWADAQTWLENIPEAGRSPGDLRLGWQASEALGNHDRAIAYARALGVRGADVLALELEAQSLLAAGRAADALAVADALAAKGELREASEYAKRAAALEPRNAALAGRAADLAARAGSAE